MTYSPEKTKLPHFMSSDSFPWFSGKQYRHLPCVLSLFQHRLVIICGQLFEEQKCPMQCLFGSSCEHFFIYCLYFHLLGITRNVQLQLWHAGEEVGDHLLLSPHQLSPLGCEGPDWRKSAIEHVNLGSHITLWVCISWN